MHAPRFWHLRRPNWQAVLLAPAGWIYDAVTRVRFALAHPVKPEIPVVCIGNLVAGGTGKTPAAIALAGLLKARGMAPVFLSRGYGGHQSGPLIVDPKVHGADDVGDEPLLLARTAPVVVSRNRADGARLAQSLVADVILMDDGLQNPSVAKDVSLCVVDTNTGIGNSQVIPAGPLRARLDFQLPRIDAVILVGRGATPAPLEERAGTSKHHHFRATIRPQAGFKITGKPVIAFAGIGDPEKFFATLAQMKANIVQTRPFGDHHRYSAQECRELLAAAAEHKAQLVTTEKDHVRLTGQSDAHKELAKSALALPVEMEFETPEQLVELILARCGLARSA